MPQPLRSVAVVLVKFVCDEGEPAIGLTGKTDITVSPTKMLTAENNVCGLRFLLRIMQRIFSSAGVADNALERTLKVVRAR
jgi:hypothetical protein